MKQNPKKTSDGSETNKKLVEDFEKSLNEFSDKIGNFVYPLIIPPISSIDEDALFEIYPDLKAIGKQKVLHVLLYSYGGDAHTAFHIGRILQEYATQKLLIYVLREAKSAATLLACAGDEIIFSEISELGPMDPQIKEEEKNRRYSPLAIKHILEFLSAESKAGHGDLVKTIADKLPTPMTLGENLKSLETGKEYLTKLLSRRMLKEKAHEDVRIIAEQLVTGYPDHGYCIDYEEAKNIGLNVSKTNINVENEFFNVMKNYKKVWDTFDYLMKSSKNYDDPNIEQALGLLKGIRSAASELVERQIKELNKKNTHGTTS